MSNLYDCQTLLEIFDVEYDQKVFVRNRPLFVQLMKGYLTQAPFKMTEVELTPDGKADLSHPENLYLRQCLENTWAVVSDTEQRELLNEQWKGAGGCSPDACGPCSSSCDKPEAEK